MGNYDSSPICDYRRSVKTIRGVGRERAGKSTVLDRCFEIKHLEPSALFKGKITSLNALANPAEEVAFNFPPFKSRGGQSKNMTQHLK